MEGLNQNMAIKHTGLFLETWGHSHPRPAEKSPSG